MGTGAIKVWKLTNDFWDRTHQFGYVTDLRSTSQNEFNSPRYDVKYRENTYYLSSLVELSEDSRYAVARTCFSNLDRYDVLDTPSSLSCNRLPGKSFEFVFGVEEYRSRILSFGQNSILLEIRHQFTNTTHFHFSLNSYLSTFLET